jgi:hypothetical protein
MSFMFNRLIVFFYRFGRFPAGSRLAASCRDFRSIFGTAALYKKMPLQMKFIEYL